MVLACTVWTCDLIVLEEYCKLKFLQYFIQQGNAEQLKAIQKVADEMKAVIVPEKRTGQLKNVYRCTIDQELVALLHSSAGRRLAFTCHCRLCPPILPNPISRNIYG